MPTYRVTVSIKTHDHVDPADIADHVANAVHFWGGQYHPDDPLFPRDIVQVRAVCRKHESVIR
jgi:hypothetical protein